TKFTLSSISIAS
ncbi:hypothetical protein D018_5220B, partial [Vibrio parahaemolyticus VP2007-007]